MHVVIKGVEYNFEKREDLAIIFQNAGLEFRGGGKFIRHNNSNCNGTFHSGGGFHCDGDSACNSTSYCINPNFKSFISPVNSYKYSSGYYYDSNSKTWWIKLGCYFRTLSDWENDFWNNPNEFPNDGSEKSQARLKLFDDIKKLIKNHKDL